MYKWLHEDDCAKVAFFDATNTTKSRREILVQRSREEKNVMLLFIESICDDPQILAQVRSLHHVPCASCHVFRLTRFV